MQNDASKLLPQMPDKAHRIGRYTGPTYYGRPSIKSSPYGWLVWSYMYIAGMAGGAQVIATLANIIGRGEHRSIVRNGRYIAVGGSAIGSVLLIADLHTPQRWYNMMRIFRSTSPMSIGTYILTTFGLTSALSATAHVFGSKAPHWMRRAESINQIPAALSGASMGSYTGALLSSTSTPMWGAAPRLLSARFASSAMATAAAALSLLEHLRGNAYNSNSLDRIACAATLADAGLTAAADGNYRRQSVASSLHDGSTDAQQYKLARGLTHALPVICYGLAAFMPQHARKASVAASLGVLAGGLLMRKTVLDAGNTSADRPEDYFSFTQESQPERQLAAAEQHARIGADHGRAAH